jgi:hypothetical protein
MSVRLSTSYKQQEQWLSQWRRVVELFWAIRKAEMNKWISDLEGPSIAAEAPYGYSETLLDEVSLSGNDLFAELQECMRTASTWADLEGGLGRAQKAFELEALVREDVEALALLAIEGSRTLLQTALR